MKKISALNSALASDKRALNQQLLQVSLAQRRLGSHLKLHINCLSASRVFLKLEGKLSESQSQLQALSSEFTCLQRDIRPLR